MEAIIQVDLDGIWTIFQHHGIEVSHAKDPVFEQSVPRFLSLFREFNLESTFFIVGSDLEVPQSAAVIKSIADAGHELANHSYTHPRNFSVLTLSEKQREIEIAERLINRLTEQPVIGFRAPSYAIDSETISILQERGYLYDSSIFPTYWSGVIRSLESRGTAINTKSNASYGKIKYSRAPLNKYHPDPEYIWKSGTRQVWEIPISVYPLIRTPIHSSFAMRFGWWYFTSAVNWLSRLNLPLVFVFHGVDLVDWFEDLRIPKLKWILKPVEERIDLFQRMLSHISSRYRIISTNEYLNL
ncbi:MAG: polysaccharide deacetylase family protein [bacterium]